MENSWKKRAAKIRANELAIIKIYDPMDWFSSHHLHIVCLPSLYYPSINWSRWSPYQSLLCCKVVKHHP
jgi:hypothetical protein